MKLKAFALPIRLDNTQLLIAGIALLVALLALVVLYLVCANFAKKKKAAKAAAAAPVAEPAVEEAVEEPVAEEPAAEEVAEEPVVEEAAEEPVAEEAAEEPVAEEAAEEAAEEPVAEEAAEEAAEEPVAEEAAEEAEEADEDDEDDEDESKEYTPLEANLPVVSAEGKTVAYSTYRRSFLARIIASPEDVQSRYDELKNALLSYKKVNARISWSYESIKSGRAQLAKFAICGKTLCLFLAIDPNTLEDSKYNVSYVGDSKKYETVPCRLRLTSKRSVKWGLELIALMAEQQGLEANPKYKAVSYVPANEPDEVLLEKGLIKKVQ